MLMWFQFDGLQTLGGERRCSRLLITFFLAASFALVFLASDKPSAKVSAQEPQGPVRGESQEEAMTRSSGCMSCHTATDEPTMHPSKGVHLGCTDCHGGNNSVVVAPETSRSSAEYHQAKEKAHVQPRDAFFKNQTRVPERAYALWLKESAEYVKFVNPGDFRVAAETCGTAGCHPMETRQASTNMMTHTGFLWGAALYNNGGIPYKNSRFGESYDRDGKPQAIKTIPPPTPEQTQTKGILPELTPLYRWEISQPGNVLRVFERGGEKKAEIGNPNGEESPGKPDDKLSDRGFGTELRTDPVYLGLQKTRLVDPVLSLPGTDDHPGDYRSSGCSEGHVIYSNDRDPAHSATYAKYGHLGHSASIDPTIPKDEAGHPIRHAFTRSIPSSQCMVCHR